ncbi:hypothetical protein HPB48_021102 [Haemaphysalis longicornis]|uniref:Transposase Tc1-like domain-containing protein n=1 Tax=Haemaphysalis longicornis TaxID=44386 RepID=A0A9J6GQ92_HAELO|nr:hypothetical protein HPB48_021102 [Haemaphysalis longicornis]
MINLQVLQLHWYCEKKVGRSRTQSRVAVQKPLLSDDNKASRLRFASEHSTWSVDDWKQVLFSDDRRLPQDGTRNVASGVL